MTFVENYSSTPFYGQTDFQQQLLNNPTRGDPILFPSSSSSIDSFVTQVSMSSPRLLPRNDSNNQLFSLAQLKTEQPQQTPQLTQQPQESLPHHQLHSLTSSVGSLLLQHQQQQNEAKGNNEEQDFSSEQFLARGLPSFDFGDIVVDELGNLVEHNLASVLPNNNNNPTTQREAVLRHPSSASSSASSTSDLSNSGEINFTATPVNTNSHSSYSEDNSNNTSNNITGTSGRMIAILRHKPRGSKGQWQCIEPGERIRVDKRKGKIVQLLVKTSLPHVTQNWSAEGYQFKVQLLDLRSPYYIFEEELPPTPTGPTIHPPESDEEKTTFGPNATIKEIQLRVRMGSISKKQMFQVSLVYNNGGNNNNSVTTIATARTIQFCSDDNGKLYTPVGRKRRRSISSASKGEEDEEDEEEESEALMQYNNREDFEAPPPELLPIASPAVSSTAIPAPYVKSQDVVISHHHHQQQQPQPQPQLQQTMYPTRGKVASPALSASTNNTGNFDAFGGPSPSIELFLQNLAAAPIPDYQARDSEQVTAKRLRSTSTPSD